MPHYKYFVEGVEVEPLNSGEQSFQYERNNVGGVVFDQELSGDLLFNSTGAFNFKTQEASDLCAELEFQIQQRCGGAWAVIYEAVFSVSEGKFDNDKCNFSVKPRKKLYLLDDVECNMLDIPTKAGGSSVVGVVAVNAGGADQRIYENCRFFADVLLFVAKKSNYRINSIISDFFQINPINVSGNALPGVPNKWMDMAFASLSDIQEPIPSDLATTEIITFKDLFSDLKVLFGVEWIIDSNYNLRVEHETFFEGSPGLDVTAPEFERYMRGTNKYSYDLKDLPKQETWRIADHDQHVTVDYGGLAALNKNRNSKTYETKIIRTDYTRIKENGQNSTEDGIFLFATDGGSGSGGTQLTMVDGIGSDHQNIYLTPEYLVRNLHTYNRPSLYGLFIAKNINIYYTKSGGIIFNSIIPVLKQEPFSVPLCCDSFNTEDQVITELGTGYLDKAEYKLKTGMLKLDLKYKINNCGEVIPTDLPNCDLWLKFNTGITLTSGRVSQWADQSGNARHATQATAADRPAWSSGNPVYFEDFPGGPSQTFLKTPSFQLFPSKRGTIFIMLGGGASTMSVGIINVLSTFDGTLSNFFDILLDSSHRYLMNTNATLYPNNGIPTRGNWAPIGLYVIRRGSDDKVNCRLNGIDCIDNPMSFPNTVPTPKPLRIGYDPLSAAGGPPFGGFELSELIIFGRELSDFEVEQMELYLTKTTPYNNIYPELV